MIIRTFDDNRDIDDFLELFRISFGKPMSREYFEWKYIKNPFRTNIHPITVAEENGRVVGAQGLVVGRMMIKGAIIYTCLGADGMVHPDFRGRRIHDKMHQFGEIPYQEHQYGLHYSFPNKMSIKGDIRVGQKQIYEFASHLKILNKHDVHRMFRNTILRLASNVLSPLLWYKARIPKVQNQHVTVKPVDDLSILEEVYNKWKKLDRIHTIRDERYLSWRFNSHPEIVYQFLAAYIGQEVKGYFVISMTEFMGIMRGTIVDYLVIDDDPNIFEPLLNSSLNMCKDNNCALVNTWVFTQKWAQPVVRNYGFLSSRNIQLRRWFTKTYVLAKPLNEHNFPYDITAIEWYLTPSDSDMA